MRALERVPKAVTAWSEQVKPHLNPMIRLSLVLAVIWAESAGNPAAWNPEPRYPYLWNVKLMRPFRRPTAAELDSKYPPKDWPCIAGDPDQEWWAQQSSWGLMQIMGAAARERGYQGGFLTDLILYPERGLEYGIKHLWEYGFQRGHMSTNDALARYNAGTERSEQGQAYAAQVLRKVIAIEGLAA